MLNESVRCLWNPTFNATVEAINKPDRDPENTRRTSTNQLLMSYMEIGKSSVKFS